MFEIEVVLGLPENPPIVKLIVPEGTTIKQAIQLSKLITGETSHQVGIYGQLKKLSDCVQAKDRVEIYLPAQDPMQRRVKLLRQKKLSQLPRGKNK